MADGALLTGGQAVFGAGGFLSGEHLNGVIQLGNHSLGLDDLAAVTALQAYAQAGGGAGSGDLIDRHEILVFAVSLLDRLLQDRAADRALLAGGHGVGLGDHNGSVLAGGGNGANNVSLTADGTGVGDFALSNAGGFLGYNSILVIVNMVQLIRDNVLGLVTVFADSLINAGAGAGSRLQMGDLPGMVVGIHGSLVGDLVVIAARAGDGGIAFLGAGGRGDGLLQVVAQSLLTARQLSGLGLMADGALYNNMLIFRASSIDRGTLIPLVLSGSLHDFGLQLLATALALVGVKTIFFTGNSLVRRIGLVQGLLVAQRGAFEFLRFALSTTNSAQMHELFVVNAGSINGLNVFLFVNKGVLTSSGNHFGIQGLTAALALVVDHAILAAGSFHTGNFNSLVLGSVHNLITQVLMAQLAFHSVDAVLLAANSILQNLSNNRNMSIGIHRGLRLGNQDLTADRALHTSRQTGSHTGGGDFRNDFLGMTGSGGADIGRILLKFSLTALGAGIQGAGSLGAGRIHVLTVVPSVFAGSLDSFRLGFLTTLTLEGIQAVFLTGNGFVLRIGLVQNPLVIQSGVLDFLFFSLSAANGAQMDKLLVINTGSGNGLNVILLINEGVLTGSGNHFGLQGLTTALALVVDHAILAAGGFYTRGFNSLVLGSVHDLVTQVLVAQLAFHSDDTVLLAADSILQDLSNYRNMSIGVHRNLLLSNQDLTADRAFHASGQTSGGAGGVNSRNLFLSVAGSRLGTLSGEGLYISVVANGALKAFAACILAGSSLIAGGLVLVTSCGNRDFIQDFPAALALDDLYAILGAGSCLGFLLVSNLIVAQDGVGDFCEFFADSATDRALLALFRVLGAGSVNESAINKGVLTGSWQNLRLQLFAAASALVVDNTIMDAVSFYTGNFNRLVLRSIDHFVSQVCVAQLALHSNDTVLLAANGRLQDLGSHRNMGIPINRDLLLSSQDLTADRALHASGQTSGGAGGGNSGNLFLSVAGSRLGSIAGEGLYIGVVTDGALEALAACALAGSSLIASGLVLVASCGNLDLFQDFPAALALDDFQAIFGAGSSLGFLLVSNLIVAQSSTRNLLGLTGSAADRALLAFLGVLGAGSIDKLAFNKGMLASSGQHLFLIGQVDSADRTLVSNLARVLASGLYALSNSLGVICRNGLITKILAADGALVPANTIGTGFAVGGSQLIDQHNVVQVLISLGLVVLEGVVAAGALVQGVAAFLTGSGDHSLLHIVAQSRDGSVALDDLGLGIVAAGASVYLTGTLGAGGIYKLAGGLQVMTQGRNLLLLQVLLTFVAMQDLFASHCTGCFFYRLPMGIRMLTIRRDIHFGSEGGSGQHGDHHHQRQKSSKDFPLHEITSIEI